MNEDDDELKGDAQPEPLADLMSFLTGVPITSKTESILDQQVFLGVGDNTNDKSIQNRDSTNNDENFDWSHAPNEQITDATIQQLIQNVYTRPSKESDILDLDSEPSDYIYAPLATAPAEDDIDFGKINL